MKIYHTRKIPSRIFTAVDLSCSRAVYNHVFGKYFVIKGTMIQGRESSESTALLVCIACVDVWYIKTYDEENMSSVTSFLALH